jgi:chromosome segregation ATPase
MNFFDGFDSQDRAKITNISSSLVGLMVKINGLVRQLSNFRPEGLMSAIEDLREGVKNAVGKIEALTSQLGSVSSHVETLFKENSELKIQLADANTQLAALKGAATAPAEAHSEVELQDLANQLKAAVTPAVTAPDVNPAPQA